MWDPDTISSLQIASKTNSKEAYERFSAHANEVLHKRSAFRGLLNFKFPNRGIDLSDVEPAKEIVKRFCTGQ